MNLMNDPMRIETERLSLVVLPQEVLQMSLSGDREGAEKTLGVAIMPYWFEQTGFIQMRLHQLLKDPSYQPWGLRAIVLREAQKMIGFANFHTKPGDPYLQPYSRNGVEFGLELFADFHRQGYALESCQALMKWAFETHAVSEFIFSISPDNLASRRLAARLGFVQVGSQLDEVDGVEDVFKVSYSTRSSFV